MRARAASADAHAPPWRATRATSSIASGRVPISRISAMFVG